MKTFTYYHPERHCAIIFESRNVIEADRRFTSILNKHPCKTYTQADAKMFRNIAKDDDFMNGLKSVHIAYASPII